MDGIGAAHAQIVTLLDKFLLIEVGGWLAAEAGRD